MFIKKYVKIFFTAIILVIVFFTLSKFFQNKKEIKEDSNYEKKFIEKNDTNLIKDVSYKARDINGNEYIVNAKEGKTDQFNKDIIFLKYIDAIVILNDGSVINIYSKYAEYNITNYNTIFKENVMLNYLDNIINGNYLELSLEKNLILMKENIIFKNLDSFLTADAIEINTKSKDSKIYMYNNEKKINIQKFN